MNYNITKHTAPAMPTLGNGTECIKILLSQASKDMHESLVPMLFTVLGAHLSGAEFQYPDLFLGKYVAKWLIYPRSKTFTTRKVRAPNGDKDTINIVSTGAQQASQTGIRARRYGLWTVLGRT
jgi:hypothetical protein